MSLDKSVISVNMYQFWLSRYKADYITNYMDGTEDSSFWNEIYDIKTNQTYNDLLTEKITDNAKTVLAALYMFDEYNLKLSDETIADVDEIMADILNEVGDGSKNVLNSELANYGVNYDILRDIYMNEQKISYVQAYLFGSDGSNISAAAKESYYQENYLHFKQIYLFASDKPIYEKDSDGQEIYYIDDNHISYDTENGTPHYVDDVVVKDTNGYIIYYIDKDSNTILYDTENGKRAYVYGTDGYPQTEECTTEEITQRRLLSSQLLERINNGENFERLLEEYNEDVSAEEYPDGMYFTENSAYYYSEILTALADMEVGEVRIVETAYGIHIVKKYSLEEGGYDDSANTDFFDDFMSKIIAEAFINKSSEYYDKIVVDEEILAKYTLENVNPCYNY